MSEMHTQEARGYTTSCAEEGAGYSMGHEIFGQNIVHHIVNYSSHVSRGVLNPRGNTNTGWELHSPSIGSPPDHSSLLPWKT